MVSERVYEGTGGNNLLTTATLVSTESASHALVTGGIWVTHASIPTGIVVENEDYIPGNRCNKYEKCSRPMRRKRRWL